MKLKYTRKKQRHQRMGVLTFLKGIRKMHFLQIYIGQNEYRRYLDIYLTLIWKFKSVSSVQKFSKSNLVDCPLLFIDNVIRTFKEITQLTKIT